MERTDIKRGGGGEKEIEGILRKGSRESGGIKGKERDEDFKEVPDFSTVYPSLPQSQSWSFRWVHS